MKNKISHFLCAAALATLTINANASTATLTDLGGNNYGVILDPIVFTVGASQGAANRMIIEDFYQFGATTSGTDISGSINWSLNGGASVAIDLESSNGVFAGTLGQVDSNDLLFNFTIDYFAAGATSISAGDTVTLSTNNMIFNTPFALTTATGPFTAHLLNGITSIATTETSVSSVPAPAAIWLFGSGLLGLIGVRKKSVKLLSN